VSVVLTVVVLYSECFFGDKGLIFCDTLSNSLHIPLLVSFFFFTNKIETLIFYTCKRNIFFKKHAWCRIWIIRNWL